jgi:hypothetical protein
MYCISIIFKKRHRLHDPILDKVYTSEIKNSRSIACALGPGIDRQLLLQNQYLWDRPVNGSMNGRYSSTSAFLAIPENSRYKYM